MRVLVTGSRDWENWVLVWEFLTQRFSRHARSPAAQLVPFTLVHGACPSGADQYAHQWYEQMRKWGYVLLEQQHPANWDRFGKSAGPIRNQVMVELGADVALACIRNESDGATGCLKMMLARKPPIPEIQIFTEQ